MGTLGAFATPGLRATERDWSGQSPVRYPDAALVSVDPRFDAYKQGNAVVERLWTGARWAEGPVWFGDGRYLLFSDIPNDRIMRWTEESGAVSVFRRLATTPTDILVIARDAWSVVNTIRVG
jgi:gluconolactonase